MNNQHYFLLVFFSPIWSQAMGGGRKLQPIKHAMGTKRTLAHRIYGAEVAERHSAPYIAHIFRSTGLECQGALVTTRWVITTHYCGVTTSEQPPRVLLGAHDISISEPTQQIVQPYKIVSHPDYNYTLSYDMEHDLAMMRLEKEVTLNDYVHPAPLAPLRAPDYAGSPLLLSSWGIGAGSVYLRSGTVFGISNEDCKKLYGYDFTMAVICIDTANGTIGLCEGDSGAPLVDIQSGHLVGLGSFIHTSDCYGPGPHGFQRISHNVQWIWDNIDHNN